MALFSPSESGVSPVSINDPSEALVGPVALCSCVIAA